MEPLCDFNTEELIHIKFKRGNRAKVLSQEVQTQKQRERFASPVKNIINEPIEKENPEV